MDHLRDDVLRVFPVVLEVPDACSEAGAAEESQGLDSGERMPQLEVFKDECLLGDVALMLPSVLPRLGTDSAVRMFPGV